MGAVSSLGAVVSSLGVVSPVGAVSSLGAVSPAETVLSSAGAAVSTPVSPVGAAVSTICSADVVSAAAASIPSVANATVRLELSRARQRAALTSLFHRFGAAALGTSNAFSLLFFVVNFMVISSPSKERFPLRADRESCTDRTYRQAGGSAPEAPACLAEVLRFPKPGQSTYFSKFTLLNHFLCKTHTKPQSNFSNYTTMFQHCQSTKETNI